MWFLMMTYAVSQSFQFKNYGVENGLSHNFIGSIYQDKEGFMWFGSLSGLDRFDGIRFKHYLREEDNPESIQGDLTRVIFEDSITNRFWVGTEKGGLHLFDKKQQKFKRFAIIEDQDTIRKYSVFCVIQQKNGNFWIGTDRGLKHFDTKRLCFNTHGELPALPLFIKNVVATTVFIDSRETLWLGTPNGLFARKKNQKEFEPIIIQWITPSNKEILDIKQSPTGQLLIGTFANGLVKVDPATLQANVLLPESNNQLSYTTRQITLTKNGTFWIGSRCGFFEFDEATEKFTKHQNDPDIPTSIPHNSVLAICKDSKGDMWLGTRLGVSYWVAEKQTFKFIPSATNNDRCLNSPSVFSMHQDNGLLYLATENGGLNIYNEKTGRFTYLTENAGSLPAIDSPNVKCVITDSASNVWLGTFLMGIDVYNPKTKKVKQYRKSPDFRISNSLPDDRVYALLRDARNRIWVGTGYGLVRYNALTDSFDDFYSHISTSQINWIYQDKQSNIWAASTDTVFVINSISGKLASTIPTGVVTRSMLEDSQGRIWLTTTGKGLAQYDKQNGTFSYINERNNLSSNLTFSALEDKLGNIWIGTSNALNKFSPSTKTIFAYFKDDGPQISQYNYNSTALLKDGRMAFGGLNGVVVFDPEKVRNNPFTPPVVLTSFSFLNSKIDSLQNQSLQYDINYCDTLYLSYKQNFISIGFAALSFSNPTKNQLAYKMDGIDQDWLTTNGNNQASYTQISPGQYKFRVKGSNNSGVWNKTEKQLVIIVTPPFYQTWWFRTIWLFATIALFFVVVYIRTNANRKQRLLLERMVKDKTTDLEKSKSEIQKQNVSLTRLSEQISNKNQQLANYAEQLESKVKSRTHELELAKTRAEESDRLKSAFLANMSHEIRTPMNGILGFTDLLKEDTLTFDERIMFVQVIEQSGQRMLNIINDLIDISKIEANQMAIRLADIPVSAVMQELQLFFEPSAEKKGLKINTNCENILPTTVLVSDKDKLMQILTNLVNNAIKFTEKGQIDIACQLGPNHITFTVKDSGIGIAPDVQPLLFKRFAQGDSAMNKKFEGAGLGLYICKSLTEMIGGRIWLESEKEKGSTFYVQLTLK